MGVWEVDGDWKVSFIVPSTLFFQNKHRMFGPAVSFDGIFHNWKAIPRA